MKQISDKATHLNLAKFGKFKEFILRKRKMAPGVIRVFLYHAEFKKIKSN